MQDDRQLLIFSGNANRPLADAVCKELGVRPGKALVSRFSDGEVQVEIEENVRRPVSYTQLDVYKRQGPLPTPTTGSRCWTCLPMPATPPTYLGSAQNWWWATSATRRLCWT